MLKKIKKLRDNVSSENLQRSSGQNLLRCPDGRCGFAMDDVDSYVDHHTKTLDNLVAEEFEKQLKHGLSEVAQKIPTAETIRKIASAPECVDGISNTVKKKLDERRTAEREARRKRSVPW